jgi:hypothetical protein
MIGHQFNLSSRMAAVPVEIPKTSRSGPFRFREVDPARRLSYHATQTIVRATGGRACEPLPNCITSPNHLTDRLDSRTSSAAVPASSMSRGRSSKERAQPPLCKVLWRLATNSIARVNGGASKGSGSGTGSRSKRHRQKDLATTPKWLRDRAIVGPQLTAQHRHLLVSPLAPFQLQLPCAEGVVRFGTRED